MHRLAERNGFGFAVKNALPLVETEFVMVVQHDRNFERSFDLAGVLDVFDEHKDVMYMGLPTSSVTPGEQQYGHTYARASIGGAVDAGLVVHVSVALAKPLLKASF